MLFFNFATPDTPSLILLACAPALAFAVDRLLGEPPLRWHPVVWMGNYLGWTGRRVAPEAARLGRPLQAPDARAFALGALAWCGGAALALGLAWGLQAWVLSQPHWLGALALGLFLKPLMAWAMLHDEVLRVELALKHSLPAGQQQLARLVSRDTAVLDATQVREAAIETLAENLNDSFLAPLFWFVLLGLPGAALYRFANTADAMWGYRGAVRGLVWEWAGKWAARADDALSWLPARLTALLLMLAALPLMRPWRRLPAEAAHTPSPNSGWPMAATALALGLRLGKPGVYTLNATGRVPAPADTLRACALAGRAAALGTLCACAALWLTLSAGR